MADPDDRRTSFGDLIAAPLVSAAEASARLAQTTAEFVSVRGKGDALDFTFRQHREVPDAEAGAARVVTEDVTVSLPLLGAVSTPNLRLDRVRVEFNLEVRSVESEADRNDAPAPVLLGTPAAPLRQTRNTDTFAKYSFSVEAIDGGTPEALARVLDLIAQSVAPIVEGTPQGEPAPTDDGLDRLNRRQLNARIDEINRNRPPDKRLSKGGTNAAKRQRIREALAER